MMDETVDVEVTWYLMYRTMLPDDRHAYDAVYSGAYHPTLYATYDINLFLNFIKKKQVE